MSVWIDYKMDKALPLYRIWWLEHYLPYVYLIALLKF